MSDSNIQSWLDHWRQLLGDPTLHEFRDPDDLAGVLSDFRSDPELLKQAFAPLPHGEQLLERVRFCIDAEPQHEGIYLVAKSIESTDEELRKLVVDALQRGSRCCEMDPPDYAINLVHRAMTPEESSHAAPLVEELGDLYIEFAHDSRGDLSDAMHFLHETLYTLAASFEVQGYCLTPLCPEEIRSIDPYEPQIQLWRRGAHAVVRWSDGSDDLWVDVFVE